MLLAVVEDPLRDARADAVERVELLERRGVEVDRRAPARPGAAAGRRAPAPAAPAGPPRRRPRRPPATAGARRGTRIWRPSSSFAARLTAVEVGAPRRRRRRAAARRRRARPPAAGRGRDGGPRPRRGRSRARRRRARAARPAPPPRAAPASCAGCSADATRSPAAGARHLRAQVARAEEADDEAERDVERQPRAVEVGHGAEARSSRVPCGTRIATISRRSSAQAAAQRRWPAPRLAASGDRATDGFPCRARRCPPTQASRRVATSRGAAHRAVPRRRAARPPAGRRRACRARMRPSRSSLPATHARSRIAATAATRPSRRRARALARGRSAAALDVALIPRGLAGARRRTTQPSPRASGDSACVARCRSRATRARASHATRPRRRIRGIATATCGHRRAPERGARSSA